VLGNGSGSPCLDLSRVPAALADATVGVDLLVSPDSPGCQCSAGAARVGAACQDEQWILVCVCGCVTTCVLQRVCDSVRVCVWPHRSQQGVVGCGVRHTAAQTAFAVCYWRHRAAAGTVSMEGWMLAGCYGKHCRHMAVRIWLSDMDISHRLTDHNELS
jgi:hypothetical protein